MPSATDRIDFGPQAEPGSMRSFTLALLVHLLLVGALTWGVHWTRSMPSASFDAELWSSMPQEAAPPPAAAAPAPPPVAVPPPPAPTQPVQETKPTPVTADVDIALEREKRHKQEKLAKEVEEKKKEKQKALELAEKAEKTDKAEKAKKAEQAALAKAKAAVDAKKLEAKKLEESQDAAKKQATAAKLAEDKRRKEQLDRMLGLAGATGAPNATGTALRASGPSASYGGKVKAKVKPNIIVFAEEIQGNPRAEVEVRTLPDGTILLPPRLVKSSGNKVWDEAVIKAIIRTETLPRDTDGRVPTPMIIGFTPKD